MGNKNKNPITENDNKEFTKRLEYICDKYADKTAVTYMRNDGSKSDFTFNQIFERIQKSRSFFERVGLQKGDRAAIISPQSPFAVFVAISLAYSNITSVLIDPTLPAEEINRLLTLADVRTIFTTPGIFNNLDRTTITDIPIFDLTQENDIYKVFDGAASVMRETTSDPDKDVIAILFSSGTTASMKGIMIPYKSVEVARPMYYRTTNSSNNINILFAYPFNHVAGFFVAFQHFLSGCGLGMIEDMDSIKLTKAFHDYQPDFFALVPKFYEIVAQKIRQTVHDKGAITEKVFYIMLGFSHLFRKGFGLNVGKYLFKSVRRQVFGEKLTGLGSGGSLCKAETAGFFLDLGVDIWANFYALTETYVPTMVTGIFDRYPAGTEGKFNRFDEVKVKIHNADESGVGEIRIKTDLIMKGYFRDAELTAAAFDVDGYFKTGDFGYVDKKGYLHVTGRIKEAIYLHTGKKVAPTDIDSLYGGVCPNVSLASCGVPCKDENFDEIHLFIEGGNLSSDGQKEIRKMITDFSAQTSTLYKISGVHFINKLPMTSVGKVKRYQLKEITVAKRSAHTSETADTRASKDAQEIIFRIVSELADGQAVTLENDLKNDLGLDSLNMLELCVALEGAFNISIDESIVRVETVQDLLDLANGGGSGQSKMAYDIENYPLEKTKPQLRILKFLMRLSRSIYRFEVLGIENILSNKNYILCPNHQSRLDVMMTWTAIGYNNIDTTKICCLAEHKLLTNPIFKRFFVLFGGIPTDRYNNPIPALKKCLECIKNGYNTLIHPEGTVTKDGNMNEFKGGAAKLAIDADVPIIPVRIEGTRTIWRLYTLFPKLFNWRKMQRHKVSISFGNAIYPENKTVEEITALIRKAVEELGNE